MLPKRKNEKLPVFYAVGLIVALFVSLHGAVAYEDVATMVEIGAIEKRLAVFETIGYLSERLETSFFSIHFNEYTLKWLAGGAFAWLIVVAAIETQKRNYIHGKEYGTSRWGTLADIKDLFAENLEKIEINRAKRLGNIFGRWQVKNEIYKQCEKDGQAMLNFRLNRLKEAEEARKFNKTANKKLYKEEQKEIQRQVKEDVVIAKREAWQPEQFKLDYKARLQDIKDSQVFKDEEKREQENLAKKEYEAKLKEYYNYAGRVAKIRLKYKDADMILTKTERISIYNFKLNNNTLIIGGSGSGKTRSYVMPNLLQAHSSFIITDPKGEILAKAGHFLQDIMGYRIRVLNLDEKSLCDGYNPFVYIHPERDGYEERVLSLIETIIVNTDGGEKQKSSDPFWPMAERLFLQSIFFFTTDGYKPEYRNMNTALKLIKMLQIEEENDNKDSDLDIFVDIFASRFGEDHIGVEQFREFRAKASGKTAKSVVISAVARLAPFKTSEVRRLFSYDNMCLDRVGEEKTAIFVVVPPTDDTYNFIAGMLFTQLFQELQYCATQKYKHKGQRLPVPCRFILDEFATTCIIPNFVKILAYARSLGIGITPIVQSLEQLKTMYEKEWGVIIDNCNTMLFLGSVTHMDTLKYMSELIGKGTFDKKTTGQTLGMRGSSSRNEDVVGRELMLPSEIREMPKEDCLLVVGGRPPFRSKKYEYKEHPNYLFTSDANEKNSFDYKPKTKEEVERLTHGEDEVNAPLTPSENAKIKTNPVTTVTDAVKQLSYVSKNINSLDVIPDEEVTVEDGENNTSVNDDFLQMLMGEEAAAKEQSRLTVSEETEAFLENLRKDKIRIEENMLINVNRLGRTFRNLDVISDELMNVDDGEGTKTIDNKLADFIMNDEEAASDEELADVADDAGSLDFSGFDKNPELE